MIVQRVTRFHAVARDGLRSSQAAVRASDALAFAITCEQLASYHPAAPLAQRRETMGNYNRIILAGNLVRDPEIRYAQSGSPVASFTIAVNRRTKQNDAVDYIDIVAWDKLAETSNTYLKKGMPVLVEGRLSIRPYESKSGEKHKAAEVVISFMQMLSRAFGESTVSTNSEEHDVAEAAP